MERRGFLGSLLGLFAVPLVAKPAEAKPIQQKAKDIPMIQWHLKEDAIVEFVGSGAVGVVKCTVVKVGA